MYLPDIYDKTRVYAASQVSQMDESTLATATALRTAAVGLAAVPVIVPTL